MINNFARSKGWFDRISRSLNINPDCTALRPSWSLFGEVEEVYDRLARQHWGAYPSMNRILAKLVENAQYHGNIVFEWSVDRERGQVHALAVWVGT